MRTNTVHADARRLAEMLRDNDRTAEVRFQRDRHDWVAPIMYRARVFDSATIIVEVESYGYLDGWQGVYMTDDPRHAASVLHGLPRYPSAD